MLNISAVLVTRGDVNMSPVMDSLPFDDIVVFDNSEQPADYKVFGRYQGILHAKHDYIYVQDDDCIVPVCDLIRTLNIIPSLDETHILSNMPIDHGNYTDSTLLGWGSIFHRDLYSRAFFRYEEFFPIDEAFLRCCDVVFTTLTPFVRVDLGHENLPWATDSNRMYNQPNHDEERAKILEQARYVRDFPHPDWR